MPREATKAVGNRYYESRMRAAQWNEKLLTRAGAAELLSGITEDSLKKYELGINRPPNDAVALMADAYNDPALRNWYCANECMLGRDFREVPVMPAERAFIRLHNSVAILNGVVAQLSEIMDDGTIGPEEEQALPGIREDLLEAKRRADEMLAVLERAERAGGFS